MSATATIAPVPIGGRVKLPGGTVIEVLGVSNGQVGLAVVEATTSRISVRTDGDKPKPARKRNGKARAFLPLMDAESWEAYWLAYNPRKGWGAFNRKYPSLDAWLAEHPEARGRVLSTAEARTLGYAAYQSQGQEQKLEPYWEEKHGVPSWAELPKPNGTNH